MVKTSERSPRRLVPPGPPTGGKDGARAPGERRPGGDPAAGWRTHRGLPRPLEWALPPLVLVLALAGFFVFVPITHAEDSRLASLVVSSPAILSLPSKPISSDSQLVAASGLITLVAAGAASPAKTGSWEVVWAGKGALAQRVGASILVDQLPSASKAAVVQKELAPIDLGASYLGGKRIASFAVHSTTVAGADYLTAKSATSPAVYRSVITLRAGRGVAVVDAGDTVDVRRPALELARRELSLLARAERRFRLAEVSYPLGAALIWWLVALGVAVAVVAVPRLVVAGAGRRDARRRAVARQQFQMRGSKVLKRRAPPGKRPSPARRRRSGR